MFAQRLGKHRPDALLPFICEGYTCLMSSEQGAGSVTFVNVFELDPDQVDKFIVGWNERANYSAAG
jgi:hypothetical protein